MKTTLKRIASCVLFSAIVITLLIHANDVVINKENNRYYYLEDFIKSEDENYKVQVYGSCHAYTSFDAPYMETEYGISSYIFANPGEIIPNTYLRMVERFKTDVPEVAIVDIWGMNPYETYMSQEDIFGKYMPVNVELLPYSSEKNEVIADYEKYLDDVHENFHLAKYKDRILGMDLRELDYNYSFDLVAIGDEGHPDGYIEFIMREIEIRGKNRGFSALDPDKEVSDQSNFHEKQSKVDENDKLPYEDDIIKYLEKIIDLCEKNDVKLIFYRAPYISSKNELRKLNWLKSYCAEKNILFCDLEKEVEFDYKVDFKDDCHLNACGARKATVYLADKIRPLLG